jgi:hypothetical protein
MYSFNDQNPSNYYTHEEIFMVGPGAARRPGVMAWDELSRRGLRATFVPLCLSRHIVLDCILPYGTALDRTAP